MVKFGSNCHQMGPIYKALEEPKRYTEFRSLSKDFSQFYILEGKPDMKTHFFV